MDQIRPWLFVGGLRDAWDEAALRRAGVGAALNLAKPVAYPGGLPTLFLPVRDGEPLAPETLRAALAFVREQREAGRPVLIACALGVSRAPTLATAALVDAEGGGVLEALRSVRAWRPGVHPHPTLWASLCAWRGEDVPYAEVLGALRGVG